MFEKCDDSFIKALVRLLQPQVLLCADYYPYPYPYPYP